MSTSDTHPEIVLGFDYGTRRIGIAVGQTLTRSATPLSTVENRGQEPDWTEIDHIVKQWQPQLIVVGMPYHADGTENALSERCRTFGEQLEQRYGVQTAWVDERLTSAEAERILQHQAQHRGRKKKSLDKSEIDKLAAKLIVESWFNCQSGQ